MQEYDVDNWELVKTMAARGWHENNYIGMGVRAVNSWFPSLYSDNLMGEDFNQQSFEQQVQRLQAVHEYNRATHDERKQIQTGRLEQEHYEDLKRLNVDYDKLSVTEKILYTGGYLAGAIADPTLLIPVGTGLKVTQGLAGAAKLAGKAKYLGSAAAIGAIDGVARTAALDWVEDGVMDHPEDLATNGAWGAGVGAAMGLTGIAWKALQVRRANKLKAGQDIDKIDVAKSLTPEDFEANPDFIAKSVRILSDNMATQEELMSRGVIGSYVNRGAQDSYKKFMSRYAMQEGMSPDDMIKFMSEGGDEFIEFEAKLLGEVADGELAHLVKTMSPEDIRMLQESLDAHAKRIEGTADFLGHTANKFSTSNLDETIGELNFFNEMANARVMDDIDYKKAVKEIQDMPNVPLENTDKRAVTNAFKQAEKARIVKAEAINPQRWAYRYQNQPNRQYHVIPQKGTSEAAYAEKALQDSVEALKVKWANRTPWAGRDFETEYMKQSDLDKLAEYLQKSSEDAAKVAKPEIPDAPWVHPNPSRPWRAMADNPDPRPYGDPAPSKYVDEISDEITTEIANAISKQAGRASVNILANIGLGTAGALWGFQTYEGIDGALLGAGIALGGKWILRKAMNTLRSEGVTVGSNEGIGNKLRQSPEENTARQILNFNSGAASAFRSGKAVISNWGPTGKAAMDTLQRFDSAVTMSTSRAMHSMTKVANKAGISQKDLSMNTNIANYMMRRLKPSDLTPGELAVAKELDRLTMHLLDSHKKVGAITPDQYRQIVADRKRRGFWPIVINEGYLFSKKGKAQWNDTFVNTKWTPQELDAAIKVLVGDQFGSADIVRSIMQQVVKDSTGRVSLTQAGAKELLQRKILTPFSVIHSDSRQDLVDSILRPFTVTDTVNAFQDFVNFSYRRIYEHRMFGGYVLDKKGNPVFNKHANIVNWADQILTETGSTRAKQYFLEQMYTAVGSMKSKLIRDTATQDRMWQQLYGKAKAFNILKLGTAAIVNALQAIVAGTIRLSKVKNTAPVIGVMQSFFEATSGYIKALPKEARMEVLGRTGAALETTRMQYIGEMSALSHSLIQVNAGPLQWLNNPTEFLRVTGFNLVETMNRAAGANMGRSYAESLIAKKIRVELGEITNQRVIDDLYKQMDELGLSTRDKYNGVDPIHYQNSVDRAGLIFSDEINFSNKTQNLPLAAQTPFAKMLLQFKTFQYHWGKFIWENLIPKKGQSAKAYAGNINALIAFMAGPGALMGIGADEVRRFVMADDRDFTMTERWLRGIGAIGGLGLWSTAIESFYSDPTRPYELVAGPTISTIINSLGGVGDVLSGKDTPGEQVRDMVEDVLPVSKAINRRVLD